MADTLVFKRAQRGLYAGKTRLSGNHISPSKRQCVARATGRTRAPPLTPDSPAPQCQAQLDPQRAAQGALERRAESEHLAARDDVGAAPDGPHGCVRAAHARAHARTNHKTKFNALPARFFRAGGLDEYVLGTSPARLASAKGESLREQITQSLGVEPRVTGVPSLRAKLSKLAVDAKRGPRAEPDAQLR